MNLRGSVVMRKLQPPFRVEFKPGTTGLLASILGDLRWDQYLVLDDQDIVVAVCELAHEANQIAYDYNMAVLASEE